jgi:fructose transport system ATP-binding protein
VANTLCDRIVVFRRGRICANLDLRAGSITGEDVVSYITGARTGTEYDDAA